MNDEAIETIEDYYYQCLFEPNRRWPKLEIKRRCYERWAAEEILERIKDLKVVSATEVIERFMKELQSYLDLEQNEAVEFVFTTALETAEDIGSLLV